MEDTIVVSVSITPSDIITPVTSVLSDEEQVREWNRLTRLVNCFVESKDVDRDVLVTELWLEYKGKGGRTLNSSLVRLRCIGAAVDAQRRRKRLEDVLRHRVLIGRVEVDGDEDKENEERKRLVERLTKVLDVDEQLVVLHRYYLSKEKKEISSIMKRSKTWVEEKLRSAKWKMRRAL